MATVSQEIGIPQLILMLSLAFITLMALITYGFFKVRQINAAMKATKAEHLAATHQRTQMVSAKATLDDSLIQGQKLQAVGTLAGGIAHDFNNLLYAIVGYTQMAREDLPKDTVTYQNLGRVLEAAHRGQELVARILAFSTHHLHHKMADLSVKEAIDGVLSLIKPTIPASVSIEFTQTQPMTIHVNKTQFHQVLVNLITNAVDAMHGEGHLYLRVSCVPGGDESLKGIPDLTPLPYCKIEVQDTGHGMEASVLQRIFEPFYTTKEVGKGTGLGLSIVHTILTEHHGAITVDTELGKGTTFTLYLPDVSALKGER